MTKTVVALYENFTDAQRALQDLVDSGISRDKISLVANDRSGEYSKCLSGEHGAHDDEASGAGKGAATGAVTGGVLGGLAGVVLGLGALAIPGIGPAIAAGPIISGLVGAGVGAASGGLLGSLIGMGVSKDAAECYSEGVRRGGTLVAVNAAEEDVDRVVDVLDRFNPIDIEERSAQWRSEGWSGYDPNATLPYDTGGVTYAATETGHGYEAGSTAAHTSTATPGYEHRDVDKGETTIPIVEEEMRVGKRAVDRGAVRVRTYVQEVPFEETVRLREEHVNVERRPVDRPVSESDLSAFKEGSFELREMAEEAVVSKQARVVEEVVISKESSEHSETVRDTLRHTEVDVDRTETDAYDRADVSTGERDMGYVYDFDSDSDYFRTHYQTNYATSGYVYSDYEPAYRFGYTMAGDSSYHGRNWEDIEMDARSSWESEHNDKGLWEKFKDAMRHGWDRARTSSTAAGTKRGKGYTGTGRDTY